MSWLGHIIGSVDRRSQRSQRDIIDMFEGYLRGCEISNASGDLAHDIDIAAGKCLDSTNTTLMKQDVAALLTKRIDQTWAVGDSQGGLGVAALNPSGSPTLAFNDNGGSNDDITATTGIFTGNAEVGDTIIINGSASNNGTYQILVVTSDTVVEVATASLTGETAVAATAHLVEQDKTYHSFIIRSAAGVVDGGMDTDKDAANLLTTSGYIQFRRIGSFLTDTSANIKPFRQFGDYFQHGSPSVQSISAGSSPVTFTLGIPSGISMMAEIGVFINATSARHFVFRHPDIAAQTPSSSLYNVADTIVLEETTTNLVVPTNASGQIVMDVDTDTNFSGDLSSIGWWDTRAKLND